jgi:hypothetical protein
MNSIRYQNITSLLMQDLGKTPKDRSDFFFPYGVNGPALQQLLSLLGERSPTAVETVPHPLASKEMKKAKVVVLENGNSSGAGEESMIIEGLRSRGFNGKIERESAFLYQAIEALPQGGLLVDVFSPHLFYGSSHIDKALREMIATSTKLISVTIFDEEDGQGDAIPRVLLILQKGNPGLKHKSLFRTLGKAGEVLLERKVGIQELQESSVWVPGRFFVEKERFLHEDVKTVQLGSLCSDIFRGAPGRFFSSEGEEEVRYLSLRHVGAGLVNVNSLSVMNVSSVSRLHRYLLTAGDVIVSCRGEFFRPLMLTGESELPVIGGDNYIIIRPELGKVEPGFLFRYLRSRAGQAFLFGMSTGKRIRVLNVRAMSEIPIPLPDFDIQKEISTKFTRAEEQLEEERRRIEQEYRENADTLFQKMGLLSAGRANIS